MPKYNHKYEEIDGELFETWTNKNGTEQTMVQISSDDEDDEIDEECRACGNPAYPNCKSSCSLFDD